MSKSLPVIWQEAVVGTIEDPKFDMFDLYGKWVPANTEATREFLAALRAGEQLEVQVGTGESRLIHTIEFEPDTEIEIKMRPRR